MKQMNRTLAFSVLLILSVILSTCYVSKKSVRQVNVSINSDFEVQVDRDPAGHFIDYYTADQYRQFFMDGLTKQLAFKNIVVVVENPEFVVNIQKITLKESLTTDTVKDPKSDDFGKVYIVTRAFVQSIGNVASPDNKKTETFTADKTDKEKLTNFFMPGTTINGKKPGPNDWRKKAFDSDEFRGMANSLGNRTCDVVTNRVNRFIK